MNVGGQNRVKAKKQWIVCVLLRVRKCTPRNIMKIELLNFGVQVATVNLIAHSHVLHSFAFIFFVFVLHRSCDSNMQNVAVTAAIATVTAAAAAAAAPTTVPVSRDRMPQKL